MVQQLQSPQISEIIYPESDGQPMADNTIQFRWITIVFHNLAWLFADDPMVFIAGDLFWYPVEGNTQIYQAPDILVVFGRPKGDRGSYIQHREENIPPQVVFEIRSPSNSQTRMDQKLVFYDRYGVEEYYLYDPQKNDLSGWLRSQGRLNVIEQMNGWTSPRLKIRFDLSAEELQLYLPDGTPFTSYEETKQDLEQERQKTKRLEQLLLEAGIDPDRV